MVQGVQGQAVPGLCRGVAQGQRRQTVAGLVDAQAQQDRRRTEDRAPQPVRIQSGNQVLQVSNHADAPFRSFFMEIP